MPGVNHWMSWEDGVDLVGMTQPGLEPPNVMVLAARMVHTPVGSAPAAIVLWQPDPTAPPAAMGFVCNNGAMNAWLASKLFAGTPFAAAQPMTGAVTVRATPTSGLVSINTGRLTIETELAGPQGCQLINRAPAAATPFWQQGIEVAMASARLTVDGVALPVTLPALSITGGPAAVLSPAGVYAR